MSEYQDIQAQISELQKRADALFSAEREGAIAMIVGLIETYQLTFDDLGFTVSKGKGAGYSGRADSAKLNAKKKAQSTTKKVAVKFRDSSGHTWTGRGIQPAWLKAALAAGQSIDSFLVKK